MKNGKFVIHKKKVYAVKIDSDNNIEDVIGLLEKEMPSLKTHKTVPLITYVGSQTIIFKEDSYTAIEKPQSHITRYVSPNQTNEAIARTLYQQLKKEEKK